MLRPLKIAERSVGKTVVELFLEKRALTDTSALIEDALALGLLRIMRL